MKRIFTIAGLVAASLVLLIGAPARALDQDGDLMPDSYELAHGCLSVSSPDGGVDYDADGLSSLAEYQYSPGLDPCQSDTDGDGVGDGLEVATGSNPLNPTMKPSVFKIGADFRATTAKVNSSFPSLVWTGSEYGLAWNNSFQVALVRISAGGTPAGRDWGRSSG
jgi:hypothetical protein